MNSSQQVKAQSIFRTVIFVTDLKHEESEERDMDYPDQSDQYMMKCGGFVPLLSSVLVGLSKVNEIFEKGLYLLL